MGEKVVFLSIFLLAAFLTLPAPFALADNDPQFTCDGITTNPEQGKLSDFTHNAEFTVNIGDNTKGDYKLQWKCGTNNAKEPTSKPNAKEISARLNRDNTILYPCEYTTGFHEIWVLTASDEKPVCRAKYEVVNSDTLCELTLNPDPPGGFTSSTDIWISGQNLKPGGDFTLFFDNQNVSSVSPPNFSGIKIEKVKLIRQGKHQVDIRRHYLPGVLGFPTYGPALCPAAFDVDNTPGHPGQIIDLHKLPACVGGSNCSSGTSQECKGETKPSVKTAIGCIHTNPGDLIQDVLKFGVGIGGGLAFLMMLLGAFQMLTSAGNPETLQAGRDRLTSAIIGLLIIIFSVLLLQIIGVDILGILQR